MRSQRCEAASEDTKNEFHMLGGRGVGTQFWRNPRGQKWRAKAMSHAPGAMATLPLPSKMTLPSKLRAGSMPCWKNTTSSCRSPKKPCLMKKVRVASMVLPLVMIYLQDKALNVSLQWLLEALPRLLTLPTQPTQLGSAGLTQLSLSGGLGWHQGHCKAPAASTGPPELRDTEPRLRPQRYKWSSILGAQKHLSLHSQQGSNTEQTR